MDRLPEDASAQQQRLEQWAQQQRRVASGASMSQRLARMPAAAKQALRYPDTVLDGALPTRLLDRGLRTSGVTLEPEHTAGDRVLYVPTPWHVLPRALRYVGVSGRDTFVDFGCGKGRMVHQAARRPFHRVIGVEVSPALAEVARRGLAARRHQHLCARVEIVVCDAKDYPIPDDLTIGYLFHPFSGQTFGAVLRNIVASIDRHPRRVTLIYVDPILGGEILATGRFRLTKWLRGGLRDTRVSRAAIFESH